MDGKRLILPDNPTLRDFQDYVAAVSYTHLTLPTIA